MKSHEEKDNYLISQPLDTGTDVEGRPGWIQFTATDGSSLIWSGGDFSLPSVGDLIRIKMNGIGAAEVIGYFREGGFIGVVTKPISPPEWLKKQLARGSGLHSRSGYCFNFGAELTTL